MWNRIFGNAKQGILRAADYAESCGSSHISTLHLLYGLTVDCDNNVTGCLNRLGVGSGSLTVAINTAHLEEPTCAIGTGGLTDEARKAVERAYVLARDMGDTGVAEEHFLLAFLQAPDCSAGRVLEGLGLTWRSVGLDLMSNQPWRVIAPAGIDVPNLEIRRQVKTIRKRVKKTVRMSALLLTHAIEPAVHYAAAAKAIARDPYPYYKFLRRRPCRKDRLSGQWFVTGYEEVSAVLKELRFSSERYADWARCVDSLPPLVDREFRQLDRSIDMQVLFSDAPEHTRVRTLTMKQFTPRVIAKMEETIQKVVDNIFEKAEISGCLDVVTELSIPLPGAVVENLLGVADGDAASFHRWTTGYGAYVDNPSSISVDLEAYQSMHSLQDYFRTAIGSRRQEPRNDLMSALMSPVGGDRLSDEEVVANCLLILTAGSETTTHFIGNMILTLMKHRGQWELLRENQALIPSAIDEVLRYESPVQWIARTAREPFEWNGRQIGKGTVVNIGLGAANRDPREFSVPGRFDITRAKNRHLAFGLGAHYCMGASLARLEATVVLRTLIERYPNMQICGRRCEWRTDTRLFRALRNLVVSLNGSNI